MTKDPIIAEIRRFRDRLARKHNYSVRAIADELRDFKRARPTSPVKVGRKAAH